MIRALRIQLPVGFGGFHLAGLAPSLSATAREFFVLGFDCGSLAKTVASDWAQRAGRRISALGSQVDLLVLSHTDFDHVCGLQSLARTTRIDTLMLPALAWRFRAAQAARYARKHQPRWYQDFSLHPVEWARSVGVRRILFIGRGGPDDERVATEPEAMPGVDERPRLVLGAGHRALAADVFAVPSGSVLTVRTGTAITWELVPILAPAQDEARLHAALLKVTANLSETELLGGFSTRERTSLRNKLASIYRRHFGKTNRSSVMLLTVPSDGLEGGWICSGDADLRSPDVRQMLENQGAARLAKIDAVHVPHHGSLHNFDRDTAAFISR